MVPGHLINTLRSVPSVTLTVESVTIVVASRGALRLHGVSGLLGDSNEGAASPRSSQAHDTARISSLMAIPVPRGSRGCVGVAASVAQPGLACYKIKVGLGTSAAKPGM